MRKVPWGVAMEKLKDFDKGGVGNNFPRKGHPYGHGPGSFPPPERGDDKKTRAETAEILSRKNKEAMQMLKILLGNSLNASKEDIVRELEKIMEILK